MVISKSDYGTLAASIRFAHRGVMVKGIVLSAQRACKDLEGTFEVQITTGPDKGRRTFIARSKAKLA